ncbi:glycerophosphoryl diester phosphodiesterase, partial [Yersinia pestis PY-19]
MQTHVKTLLA